MKQTQMYTCYRPKRSFGQGNIFTSVCHEFCSRGGGGSAPNFRGGVSVPNFRGGGSALNFGGGVCSKFSGGGCLLQILGGCLDFWNTVNVRLVRILLECILVEFISSRGSHIAVQLENLFLVL